VVVRDEPDPRLSFQEYERSRIPGVKQSAKISQAFEGRQDSAENPVGWGNTEEEGGVEAQKRLQKKTTHIENVEGVQNGPFDLGSWKTNLGGRCAAIKGGLLGPR